MASERCSGWPRVGNTEGFAAGAPALSSLPAVLSDVGPPRAEPRDARQVHLPPPPPRLRAGLPPLVRRGRPTLGPARAVARRPAAAASLRVARAPGDAAG